jgi:hypothetical protein
MLGIRPGIDVTASNWDDIVFPRQGGMSVSPAHPTNLPYFRRPPELGGTGKDPIWSISSDGLEPALRYRPDPESPGTHGFIEPVHPRTLEEYQDALATTNVRWQRLY